MKEYLNDVEATVIVTTDDPNQMNDLKSQLANVAQELNDQVPDIKDEIDASPMTFSM